MAKPKLGSIVSFSIRGQSSPAIIVAVHSDLLVNVRVFTDSNENPPHYTSVPHEDHAPEGAMSWV